jgi:hypothetical protein
MSSAYAQAHFGLVFLGSRRRSSAHSVLQRYFTASRCMPILHEAFPVVSVRKNAPLRIGISNLPSCYGQQFVIPVTHIHAVHLRSAHARLDSGLVHQPIGGRLKERFPGVLAARVVECEPGSPIT